MVTKGSAWNLFILLVGMSLFLLPLTIGDAAAENIFLAGYQGGFSVSPKSKVL